MSRRSVPVWARFAAALVAAVSCAAVFAPEPMLAFLAKEGPAEDLTIILLLVAAAAWWRFSRQATGGQARWLRRAVAFFCLIILGEETDWGGTVGLWAGFNLHNSWGGASYNLFMLPFLVVFAASFVDRGFLKTVRQATGPALPTRVEVIVCVLLLLATDVVSLLTNKLWERALEELMELVIYIGMIAAAGRGIRGGLSGKTRTP